MAGKKKKKIEVEFFQSNSGREYVKEWLRNQTKEDRKTIGKDIRTLQYGWPIGMPLVEKIKNKLWEIRSNIKDGIVRTFFTIDEEIDVLILLHITKKKTKKLTKPDLTTAELRLKQYQKFYGEKSEKKNKKST